MLLVDTLFTPFEIMPFSIGAFIGVTIARKTDNLGRLIARAYSEPHLEPLG